MLKVCDVHPNAQEKIPAVTHVDGTARVQTLSDPNDSFYKLIESFYNKTGIPVLLNTSFNIAGDPIVETPEDAIHCYLNTNIDYLVLGKFLVSKKNVTDISQDYKKRADDILLKEKSISRSQK